MLLTTSCPTWVEIVFVIWIVFAIGVTLLLFNCRKKKMAIVYRSLLYEKTKQRIDDYYTNLDRNQLTPWGLFNTGKMPKIKNYYGGTIKYSGSELVFSGTSAHVFWEGFIEPFLEHGITEVLERVADEALAKQLDPEPCINEAAGMLDGIITRAYNRMAEIDQRLRRKGCPESARRRDVSEKIGEMSNYLQRHKEAVSEITALRYQYFLNMESRQNKNLWIAIIALGTSIMSALIALVALFKK